MILVLCVTYFLKGYLSEARPLPHPASTAESIFSRSDASTSDTSSDRSVLDILWSCLATTFACTWVSVHPNLPFKAEGSRTLLMRRVFLMLFAILAPEIMIMWAFKQWRGAVMIRDVMNDADPGASPWTTKHGHFLQMGGFRIYCTTREQCISDDPNSGADELTIRSLLDTDCIYLPAKSSQLAHDVHEQFKRVTGIVRPERITREQASQVDFGHEIWQGALQLESLKHALCEGLITMPSISEEEISDRSKGDALSKGVALLQLTWFIIQIIARAVQGLAITELELTTAALAGLNSAMYIFWWNKPLDVRCPIIIRTKGAEEILLSKVPNVRYRFSEKRFSLRRYLWSATTCFVLDTITHIAEIFYLFPRLFYVIRKCFKNARFRLLSRSRLVRGDDLGLYNFQETSNRDQIHEGSSVGNVTEPQYPESIRNKSVFERYPVLLLLEPFFYAAYLFDLFVVMPISLILDDEPFMNLSPIISYRVERSMATIFYSEKSKRKPLLSASCLAGALFGAIHCLAWNFDFPSHDERIIWRVASLCVVGTCALTFISTYTFFPFNTLMARMGRHFELISNIVVYPLIFAVPITYPIARIFLLVLAVVSLRSLPPSAFQTVQWIELIPHI